MSISRGARFCILPYLDQLMRTSLIGILVLSSLTACATVGRLPLTPGERASGFGYVPLDGLAVVEGLDETSCRQFENGAVTVGKPRPLLEDLPDLSVRFAVATFAGDGSLSFGPAQITARGQTYRAVLDYVNVDALPVVFYLRKFIRRGTEEIPVPLSFHVDTPSLVVRYEARIRPPAENAADSAGRRALAAGFDEVTIPVYVGLGMRLSADIRALESGIALTSLGAIAAEAQQNGLAGTLTVQTIGITGKSIATALPLPSKLDQTTVENGILALGSSRAIIYSSDSQPGDVTRTPRIVGLYSPVGSDPRLINAIYSELSRRMPPWPRRCGPAHR